MPLKSIEIYWNCLSSYDSYMAPTWLLHGSYMLSWELHILHILRPEKRFLMYLQSRDLRGSNRIQCIERKLLRNVCIGSWRSNTCFKHVQMLTCAFVNHLLTMCSPCIVQWIMSLRPLREVGSLGMTFTEDFLHSLEALSTRSMCMYMYCKCTCM